MIDILKNEYLQISGLFPVVFFINELHKSKNEFVKKLFFICNATHVHIVYNAMNKHVICSVHI